MAAHTLIDLTMPQLHLPADGSELQLCRSGPSSRKRVGPRRQHAGVPVVAAGGHLPLSRGEGRPAPPDREGSMSAQRHRRAVPSPPSGRLNPVFFTPPRLEGETVEGRGTFLRFSPYRTQVGSR